MPDTLKKVGSGIGDFLAGFGGPQSQALREESKQRAQRRQSSMKIGGLVADEIANNPESALAETLAPFAPGLASGDILLEDVINTLRAVPQSQMSSEQRDMFSSVKALVDRQMNGQLTPEEASSVGPRVSSFTPPGTGVTIDFPKSDAELQRDIQNSVKESQEKQKVVPGEMLRVGNEALRTLDEIENLYGFKKGGGLDIVKRFYASTGPATTGKLDPKIKKFASLLALVRTGRQGDVVQRKAILEELGLGDVHDIRNIIPSVLKSKLDDKRKEVEAFIGKNNNSYQVSAEGASVLQELDSFFKETQ